MNKFLVIGPGSFSGKHFCKYLESRGEQYVTTQLRDHAYSSDPIPWGEITHVVNFAAMNIVAPSWDMPQEYFKVNVLDQIPLWDMLRNLKPRNYVHISTPEVCGSGRQSELTPYNPSTPYAASRAAAEMMLKMYSTRYGMNISITRAANVYGPGQQDHRIIPATIKAIREGVRLKLDGGGHSIRGFLHIEDACAAYYKVALEGQGLYCVPGQTTLSIRQLVDRIAQFMGKRIEDVIQEVPERPGKDYIYDLIGSCMYDLNWKPKIELNAGIQEMIRA